MAIWTEEVVNPSLISNTTMTKIFLDGVHKIYRITPNDGYVLHDKDLDREELDPFTLEPTGNTILGFYEGNTTVRYDYDFTANPREFYAVLADDAIGDIFNVPSGTPEIM